MKNEATTRGMVTETLADLRFKVELPDGREVIAYSSGKMKLHKIKVLVGDKVDVVLDPYGGKSTNRIVKRV